MKRLAILNGQLDYTADPAATDPPATLPWAIRVTVAALAEVIRLHRLWADAEAGGKRADLRGADLQGADLRGAYLQGAYLQGAYLPSPTMVLLTVWGTLAPALTVELMRYDASCHPDPARFDEWATTSTGRYPYDDVNVERAAQFTEDRDLWREHGNGPCPRPYDLMIQVLAEKCPEWTEEQRAAFEARGQGVEEVHALLVPAAWPPSAANEEELAAAIAAAKTKEAK